MARRPPVEFKRDIRIPAETRPAFLIGAGVAALVALVAAGVLPVRPIPLGQVADGATVAVVMLFEWASGCVILALTVWVVIRFVVFDGQPKKIGHYYAWKIFAVAMAVGLALTGLRTAAVTARDITPRSIAASRRMQTQVAQDIAVYQAEASSVFDPNALKPQALAAHPDLKAVERDLKEGRALIAARRGADQQMRASLAADLRRTRLDPARLAQLQQDYARRTAYLVAEDEAYWMARDQMLDHATELAAMLDKHRGAWSGRGARLVFSNRQLMQDYARAGTEMMALDNRARRLAADLGR